MSVSARRPRARSGRVPTALALLAICLLAFLVRALSFEGVFVGDDVLFAVGDSYYQARLALYSFVNFPSPLTFDPYINYPDGGAVQAPPLLDLIVAGIARVVADDVAAFERVLAWWSPALGALTPLPVYFAARFLAGRGVALGAAMLSGAIPVLATTSQVGNADHHAAQALLGAVLLALVLAAASPRVRRGRLVLVAMGHALMRYVILLSWSGSLLYVALADGLLLLLGALGARRDLLALQALGALAGAAGLLPVLLALPTAPGGPYSAVALSRLHACALLAIAAVATGAWVLERWRPRRGAASRLMGLGAVAALVAAALLALPGPRQGVLLALRFLGTTQQSGSVIVELMPLFPLLGRSPSQPAEFFFGYFAYLVPLAPLGALLATREPAHRSPALLLAGWTAVLGTLAIWQARYGVDLTPSASIAFALLLGAATRPLAHPALPRPLRPAAAIALGLALLWPALHSVYLPPARNSLAALRGQPSPGDPVLRHPGGSLVRFLEEVRSATPETSGYLEASRRPEYGVLCRPNLGHMLHYVARRASAADGLVPPVGPENFAASQRFFQVQSEAEAVAIARRLEARYVLTAHFPGIAPGTLEARLQLEGGAGAPDGSGVLQHFRLVTEGPAGGRPLGDLFGFPRPAAVVPYRLFEIVAGAILEVRAAPGTPVAATLRLHTPFGRRFAYRARAISGPNGIARLLVPYPTERAAPTFAAGPWVVRAGRRTRAVPVSEAQVRDGATVIVPTEE